MVNEAHKPFRVALVAGELSGDELGAAFMHSLRLATDRELIFTGVGGKAMCAAGLSSLFDMDDIAVMGISAVVARLPKLVSRINQTAQAIIDERPDLLLIIDSPDFTHRVARKVRAVLPDIIVVNYVCPSVWAWRPGRAKKMAEYVDHVLALLPFEPEALKRLNGPDATFVGHPLGEIMVQPRASLAEGKTRELLVLPGSRHSEVKRLLPDFKQAIEELSACRSDVQITLPAVPHLDQTIRDFVLDWALPVKVVFSAEDKKAAFARADAALAASGTVCLELAIAGVPMIATYRLDPLARQVRPFIKTWSANLPNLILGYPAIPEFYDEFVRPALLARHIDRLLDNTPQRQAQIDAFFDLQEKMHTAEGIKSSDLAAKTVLNLI